MKLDYLFIRGVDVLLNAFSFGMFCFKDWSESAKFVPIFWVFFFREFKIYLFIVSSE